MIHLRDYQQKAVTDIRAAMAKSRRVLFQLPTGGGKTVIFSFVTNGAAIKGKRVYILAHRQEILRQISAAIAQHNLPHGWIAPGRTPTTDNCQIGMIQTVARRLDTLPAPDMLIVDEAHHAAAQGQYATVLAAWPGAYVLGVTATPERLDGRGLNASFDVMVQGPQSHELIDRGFLANFVYLAPELATFDGVKSRAGDYVSESVADIMDKPQIIGSAISHYQKYLDGKTAIAFCVTVAHAEHVAQQFRDVGIPAASIDGKMLPQQRMEICAALATGRIKVLTSCELISEGFDAPSVNGAILLRPTKSLAMYLQQIGRCLRLKPDGSSAVILDHVGNYSRHGMPNRTRSWSLEGRDKKKEKFDTKKCDLCFKVFEVKKDWKDCAECDERDDPKCALHVKSNEEREPGDRLISEVAGELRVVSDSPEWAGGINIIRASGPEWKAMIAKADTREKLSEIAKIRGYKRGWVAHMMKIREQYHGRDL